MDLCDLSREVKSFLVQDRRGLRGTMHRERASLVLVGGLGLRAPLTNPFSIGSSPVVTP